MTIEIWRIFADLKFMNSNTKSNIMESTEWIQMIEKSTGMEIENADNSGTRKPGWVQGWS